MPKYAIGFSGHFYVEADNLEQANEVAQAFSLPANNDGAIRIDYVELDKDI